MTTSSIDFLRMRRAGINPDIYLQDGLARTALDLHDEALATIGRLSERREEFGVRSAELLEQIADPNQNTLLEKMREVQEKETQLKKLEKTQEKLGSDLKIKEAQLTHEQKKVKQIQGDLRELNEHLDYLYKNPTPEEAVVLQTYGHPNALQAEVVHLSKAILKKIKG